MTRTHDGQWPGETLRSALQSATSEGQRFWASPTGAELLVQIDCFIAPQIAGWVRSLLGYAIEPAEVTNTIVLRLSDPKSATAWAKGFAAAHDPWSYLAICARRSAADEAGHRVGELDAMLHLPSANLPAADAHVAPDHDLTPLPVVISRTASTIEAYVEATDGRPYGEAVRWFAENPATHQGHGLVTAKGAPELRSMGFAPDDIAALARVTWGGRPKMHVTSLFWAYLHDEHFSPYGSRPHRLALMDMRRRLALTSTALVSSRASGADAST